MEILCPLSHQCWFSSCTLLCVVQEDVNAFSSVRDPALYGPERLSNVADTVDGKLNTEDFLKQGRHGGWTTTSGEASCDDNSEAQTQLMSLRARQQARLLKLDLCAHIKLNLVEEVKAILLQVRDLRRDRHGASTHCRPAWSMQTWTRTCSRSSAISSCAKPAAASTSQVQHGLWQPGAPAEEAAIGFLL